MGGEPTRQDRFTTQLKGQDALRWSYLFDAISAPAGFFRRELDHFKGRENIATNVLFTTLCSIACWCWSRLSSTRARLQTVTTVCHAALLFQRNFPSHPDRYTRVMLCNNTKLVGNIQYARFDVQASAQKHVPTYQFVDTWQTVFRL